MSWRLEYRWVAFEIGAVGVKEGRNRQNNTWAERMHPGESGERIGFPVGVLQQRAWVDVGIVGVEGHLIKIAARLGHKPELILCVEVVND